MNVKSAVVLIVLFGANPLTLAADPPRRTSKPDSQPQEEIPSLPDDSSKQEYPELMIAVKSLSQGKVDEARKLLHEMSRKHQEFPSEYVVLYHVLARANEASASRHWLERAFVETPRDPEPRIIAAEIAIQDKRCGEAELDLEKATQLLLGYSNAARKPVFEMNIINDHARIAEARGQWPEAKTRLEEYLKKSPDDLAGWQRLAHAKFSMPANHEQNVTDAYKTLQHAKQIEIQNSKKNHTPEQMLPAAAILAQFFDEADQKAVFTEASERAKKFFLFAIESNPHDLKLRFVVGKWALENGETALAREQVKEALRIGPKGPLANADNLDTLMLKGTIALWDKQWAAAQDYFEKAFAAEPKKFDVRNYLALALVEQNVPAKQAKALELAYGNYQNNKDNKNNLEAVATLCWVYFRARKFDLASAAMDEVIRTSNGQVSDPDTATYVAYILDHADNGHNGLKYKAKLLLDQIVKSGRPFRMKPEALELYKKLKDEKAPETP